jgi:NAD-dependent deacetylase
VHDFYNLRRRRQAEARPNSAHRALARLERNFPGQVLLEADMLGVKCQ